jgi:hypothetical protein
MSKNIHLISLILVFFCNSDVLAAPTIKPLTICLLKNGSIQAKSRCGIGEQSFNVSVIRQLIPKGAKGEPGVQGLKGELGAQGMQGVKGEQGIQGLKGDTGIQGLKGDTGAQGIQGIKGDTGNTGAPGYVNFASCYPITSTTFGSNADGQRILTANCLDGSRDFMLSRAIKNSSDERALGAIISDVTTLGSGGIPVGSTVTESSPNGYASSLTVTCCQR